MRTVSRADTTVLFGILSLIAAARVLAQDDAVSGLETLNRALDAGVPSFVAKVKAEKLSPPLIYSDWYVSEMAKTQPERAAVERQKREFGRRLVEAFDRSSEEILVLSHSSTRERAATTLLDLADWIASRRGYGNMFIFDRCQDMATVPVAHLIADLNYPEAKLDALLARFVSWADEVRMCADALNTEAPEPIFVPGKGSTLDDVQDPIGRVWNRGERRVMAWRKDHGYLDTTPEGPYKRRVAPADLAFFCDDFFASDRLPLTALNQWDSKAHGRLVVGLGSKNTEHIRQFALFRKKIGSFPTKPPSWWKPGSRIYPTPETAAFDQAWEPFRGQLGPIYAPAAMVYTATTANTFFDQDTQYKRRHEIKQRIVAGGYAMGPDGRVRYNDPRLRVGPDGDVTIVAPASSGPTTRPNAWSIRIELPGTRPATQPTTRLAGQ